VINTVAGFAGEIDIWDVVNEFVHTPTWANKEQRDSPETAVSRADYVEKALRWAHLANSQARLILNEYQMIPDVEKPSPGREQPPRERFMAVVEELDKRGAPGFEVGIQAHEPREEWFAPEDVRATCDAFQKLGHRVHMTEFIPQSSGKPITGRWRTGTWTEEAQADFATRT
jgi:GH35 family endo-1,4-beta-xylanase